MTARPSRSLPRRSPARWLLRRALPGDERDEIIAELEETRAIKFPAGGARAWLWTWRQALSFSLYFLAERYHEATRDRALGTPRARGGAPVDDRSPVVEVGRGVPRDAYGARRGRPGRAATNELPRTHATDFGPRIAPPTCDTERTSPCEEPSRTSASPCGSSSSSRASPWP